MAWQLIYTSAPRLLAAGQTGFGTVARHRAVSSMLASTIERFSQFARLQDHDPRRVVHTYRTLSVGAGTHHVFSCLQDAGSDYTGRTNHIAHHVIAETREIRALSAAGLTPADVLLALTWRTSWTEGARYLDPSEEVDLSSLAASTSQAWDAITGNPASARLLISKEALKGCYLIARAGVRLLEIFRESLLEAPGQAWQTSFTTCLEPNDDVADFRWVGLSPASPMRGQVETSNRLVLDLTRPATLPPPPEPEAAPPVIEAVVPIRAPEPAPPIRGPGQKETLRPQGSGHETGTGSSMGGWSPKPQKKATKQNKKFIILSLVVSAVLILAAGGAMWRHFDTKKARDEFHTKVDKTWKEFGLVLTDTKTSLLKLSESDSDNADSQLISLKALFTSIKNSLKNPLTEKISQPEQNEDDLKELLNSISVWQKLHSDEQLPWQSISVGAHTMSESILNSKLNDWRKQRGDAWEKLSHQIKVGAYYPGLDDTTLTALREKMQQLLQAASSLEGTKEAWSKLLADLKGNKPSLVTDWLKTWDSVVAAATAKDVPKTESDTPQWLQKLAKERGDELSKIETGKMAAAAEQEAKRAAADKKTQDDKDAKALAAKIEKADSPEAPHTIHIVTKGLLNTAGSAAARLRLQEGMQVYFGGVTDVEPITPGIKGHQPGTLKKWDKSPTYESKKRRFCDHPDKKLIQGDYLVFSETGEITQFPASMVDARILVRNPDGTKVLFDLRIVTEGASQSSLLPFTLKTELLITLPNLFELPELGQLLKRVQFIGGRVEFKLRAPTNLEKNLEKDWDLKLQDEKCAIIIQQPSATPDEEVRSSLENTIRKADQAIKDAIKPYGTKHSGPTYTEELRKWEIKIKVKEAERNEAQQTLDALPKPKELPLPKLPSGEYTVIAAISEHSYDICKVKIAPAKKSPANTPK